MIFIFFLHKKIVPVFDCKTVLLHSLWGLLNLLFHLQTVSKEINSSDLCSAMAHDKNSPKLTDSGETISILNCSLSAHKLGIPA